MSAATKGELQALHGQVAKKLAQLLKESDSAALLNVARQFLKDQHIQAVPTGSHADIEGVISDLEELENAEFPTDFPQ